MWKNFWLHLNIRKFLALLFGLAYTVGVFLLFYFAIATKDKEILMWGLSGLAATLSTLLGYYFGFTNGQSSPSNPEDSK